MIKRVPRIRSVRPALLLVAMALALLAISRTSGAGWPVVLIAGLSATLTANILLSVSSIFGSKIQLDAPQDVVVGVPFAANAVHETRHRWLPVGPLTVSLSIDERGAQSSGDSWSMVQPSGETQVNLVPDRRGVFKIYSTTRCGQPFGLIEIESRSRKALGAALLFVAPAPLDPGTDIALFGMSSNADSQGSGSGSGELIRSVREYRAGDPPRKVSWPNTARSGHLMVKELESSRHTTVVVLLDLSGPPAAAELNARHVAGLIDRALSEGVPVELRTVEQRTVELNTVELAADPLEPLPRTGMVTSSRDAGRRLACAVPGAPDAAAIPIGARVVRFGPQGAP